MFATKRLVSIASLLSTIALGCGGSGSGGEGPQPDSGNPTEGGVTPQGDDGSTPPGDDSGTSSTSPDGGCAAGYQSASGVCIDIDECTTPALDTCDVHATCSNTVGSFTCACNVPYTGDGKTCTCTAGTPGCAAANGSTCSGNGDCQNGHCVGGTCCASACTTPAACETATGATCGGGATCVYPSAADGASCDDGNACTTTDTCSGGHCTGSGAKSCDDGNPCTTDSCSPTTGCVHDGTGVTTTGCKTDDLCSTYKCAGDAAGTCIVDAAKVDCSGQADACNSAVCDPTSGTCTKTAKNENGPCQDGNACTSGDACHSGVCTASATLSCDDGNPCTDDSCDTTLGCSNVNNSAACDDGNPCTVGDTCSGGLCQLSTPMDCSAAGDACNVGVCVGGNCGKTPKGDGTACDDGHPCTTTDVCASGTCTGSGNACGANSTGCTDGTPVTCSCASGFSNSNGQCVPPTNECAASPCVAGATCADPSSAIGDFTCTCPTGFSGDGKTSGSGCTNINDCVGNTCGSLGTCVDGINSYTCSCNPGSVSVNSVCVCDMSGTFALQESFTTSWSGLAPIEDGTNVPSTTWALRTQTYDASGNLTIATTACGGSTFDLCTSAFVDQAYAQYFPTTIYGTSGIAVGNLTIALPNALQGQPYTEPQSATLLGISLTNPTGAWPAADANIGPGANQTNGAAWLDPDGDGKVGVTSFAVPPGGVSPPGPLQTYGAKSAVCPRSNYSAATAELYAYIVGFDGAISQTKRIYTGQRVLSSFSGTIASCDASGAESITGTIGGPDSGQAHVDARIGGCLEVSGGNGETDCNMTARNFYDSKNQSEHITSGSFILKRVPAGTSCTTVRSLTYP